MTIDYTKYINMYLGDELVKKVSIDTFPVPLLSVELNPSVYTDRVEIVSRVLTKHLTLHEVRVLSSMLICLFKLDGSLY